MTTSTEARDLEAIFASIRAIKLPPIPEPTPEDLQRRREAIDRMRANRDRMRPLGISSSELIREVREELEGVDE